MTKLVGMVAPGPGGEVGIVIQTSLVLMAATCFLRIYEALLRVICNK